MINQPFNVFKDTSEIQVVPLLKKRTQGALGCGVNYQLVKAVIFEDS